MTFIALLKTAPNNLPSRTYRIAFRNKIRTSFVHFFLFCLDTTPLQFPRKKRVTKGYHETSSVNDAATGSKAANN